MKNKKLFAILTLVCFMFTLMPVAAFAADGDVSVANSYIYQTEDKTSVTYKVGTAATGVEFSLDINETNGTTTAAPTTATYVWVVDSKGAVAEATVTGSGVKETANIYDVFEVPAALTKVNVTFPGAGDYTVYAGIAKKGAKVDSVSDISAFADPYKITVRPSVSEDPDTFYAINGTTEIQGITSAKTSPVATVGVDANGVASGKIIVKFTENDRKTLLRNKTVYIESTSAAVSVNKDSASTGSRGQIDFTVAGTIEGTYYVELTVEGTTWFVKVTVGDTGAAYIETANQPYAPQALYGDLFNTAGTKTKVRFNITDINGNIVTGTDQDEATTGMGMNGIVSNAVDGKYIVLTEKPADSELESENLSLKYVAADKQWYLDGVGTLDAEGTYAVKVILDNGATATATWEVKKFATPVQLRIDAAVHTVALGAEISPELTYVDANGVEKLATDATLAATGYAVADVTGWAVTAKSDEKYVGEKITVTAVSDRYNLVTTTEYTVVGEAVAIAFVDKTADVNVNNRLTWNLVDESGARIAIANATGTSIQYIVLDKPEDAKVTVTDATNGSDLIHQGIGKMNLTSNKVGNVTVQVIVKAEYAVKGAATNQVKYYTGTQVFAVGTEGTGDVVVFSIGSDEAIVNDKVVKLEVAPFIENGRTFVQYRTVAEAFGATVAYDEATQAVTAELNGVTVVMTIGSATYTVNGVEKTADVAPYVIDGRTVVPIRFMATAFGIDPIVTTNPADGTVADVLFVL